MKQHAIGRAVSAAVLLTGTWVYGQSISSYAVFGNAGVTYNGFSTTTGTVGSNADVNLLAASDTIASIQAYGNFNGSGDYQNVSGATIVNGNFLGGPLSSYGSLDVGGTASLQGNVTNNLTVGGDITTTAYVNVGGNEYIGGNANLGWVNKVDGTLGVNKNVSLGIYSVMNNVIHGGTLTYDSTTTIANASQGMVNVQPQKTALVTVPMATNFVAGGPDQTLPLFATSTLSPGHYGVLTFNGSNTLNLTAGNYYFSSIVSNGQFDTLNLNLSSGEIHIFVAGSVDFLNVGESINGQSFSSANPALASQVTLEAHGPVIFDNVSPANGSTFFGTIFDPYSSITTGVNESFVGSLLSGQSVNIGGANVTYVPSAYVATLPLPEPGSFAVMASFAAMQLCRRRRRIVDA